MELDWTLPQKKESPLYISYTPDPVNHSETFLNPFLGYPVSPIIGRYNRGEYRIGQTLFQLEFKCKFNPKIGQYECGGRVLHIPQKMVHNLRNIPEVIVNNKAAGIKSSPEVLPEEYPVREQVSLFWILSFGEFGTDFLNYLNHMYILAETLFLQEKLQRSVHYLPIYAYLPEKSGLNDFEIERGLNFNNYRGEYMSFHLNKGAPAFSPNNMRLSVVGGKIVTSKQPQKQQKKQKNKPKYVEKEKMIKEGEKNKEDKLQEEQFALDWDQIINSSRPNEPEKKADQKEQKQEDDENKPKQENPDKQRKEKKKEKKQQSQEERQFYIQQKKNQKIETHQGFIHFYTSVLLQKDYRIYYHWHIEDRQKQDIFREVWSLSRSIEELSAKYQDFLGLDPMILEINRLLFGK